MGDLKTVRNNLKTGLYHYPKEIEQETSKGRWTLLLRTLSFFGFCFLLWILFGGGLTRVNVALLFTVSIGTVLCLLVSMELEERFFSVFQKYVEACETLRFNHDAFARLSGEEQKRVAENRLKQFGRRIIEAEAAHPDEPFANETVDAREAFKKAYAKLLAVGLIEDVGYGKFVTKE